MNKKPKTGVPRGAAGAAKTVRLGMVGLGTVGTGTAKVLQEHQREIARRLGCKLEMKVICSRTIHQRDLSWLRGPVEITADWRDVVNDPDVDAVIELVGELKTARAIALATIAAGKHLVTANKQLVAEHGIELAERSRAKGVKLGIEACVAGGTPILHAIRAGLAGESFAAVYGILNGTTNYILTEMEQHGTSFADALGKAQELGYAEPDPTFDVEGIDARYKIAILAMVCFGQAVRVGDIPAEGITRIEQVDFAYAHRLGHTIRLIGAARKLKDDRLEISVYRQPMISASLAACRHSGQHERHSADRQQGRHDHFDGTRRGRRAHRRRSAFRRGGNCARHRRRGHGQHAARLFRMARGKKRAGGEKYSYRLSAPGGARPSGNSRPRLRHSGAPPDQYRLGPPGTGHAPGPSALCDDA